MYGISDQKIYHAVKSSTSRHEKNTQFIVINYPCGTRSFSFDEIYHILLPIAMANEITNKSITIEESNLEDEDDILQDI